jgi:hypothetical protein
MARPVTTKDIEVEQTEFATVDVSLIADRGDFLKAYATFMEAVQKARGDVDIDSYSNRARFTRPPTAKEQDNQLKTAQTKWDERKKYYDTMRDVGKCEYDYQRSYAEEWAKEEDMPWPPPHVPISEFDRVICGIDEVVSE